MSTARHRSEPPPPPPPRQTNGISSGPSEIQSLLQVVYSHQRGHEDGTHDPTASVPRCRTMLLKVKRVLPKMLRLISSAHTDVAVEMLGDMCELLALLIHARVCPHAATAVFVDEPRTTADQANALYSTQSFATTATVLLYLVSFYCNERLLDAQPKVLEVMVQLVVLLQTREAPASLHFFRDSVELLEDCLLLEECLKRSEVESTEATATVASVACYLNTAIHAFNGADGPLGSGSSTTLCGCMPVDDLTAVHARKQQLKALLPPIHVPSYGAAIALRKNIERLIADLIRVIGPQFVLDQSQQRLCLVVEPLIGRDIELVSKMSQGSIVGGASASDTKAVVNATCELILALLCANCDFERSFLQVARVFFQGASGYAQMEESASGVAQILDQVAVHLPRLSLLGQEELWSCIIYWHRERIEWVAQFPVDALPLSWQTLLAPSLRLYGCMLDELLCISVWASVDLLQVVAGKTLDRDVRTNTVKMIHAYFSVQTRLVMFVQVCSRALTMRQQQRDQEGVMQKTKRRRTHSQESRVPSTRDDLQCCEEISNYVLDLVFGRKRDAEDDVESLVLALQVLLPLRPLTDRVARVESQTITRIVIQRVEEVVISCERSESGVLSAAAVELTTLLLTYLQDNEIGRFRLFTEGVILSPERNVPMVKEVRERSIDSLSTAQIFAMVADYNSLRNIPLNWTAVAVRNWLDGCDNFLQPLAVMDPVLRRQFLVLLVWRHHRAFNLRVERWVETKPGQVIKRICEEPHRAGDIQAAFISMMPMLLVFMDQDGNSSAIRDQTLRGLTGFFANSGREGALVTSTVQAFRAAVCIHSTLGAAHEGYREWPLPNNQSCCRASEAVSSKAASQSVVPPDVLLTASAWFATKRSDFDVSAQLQLLALAGTLLRHATHRKADDGVRAWAQFIFSALTDEDRVVRRVAIRSLRWCVECPLFMEFLVDPDEGPRSALSVMEQLNNAIAQAMKARDFLLLESCIEAIGTMCWSKKVTEGDRSDILVWGVVQLLVLWTNAHGKQSTVSTAVYDQMWRLFTRHGLSWKQLFVEYPEDLYYPVMDTLLRTRCLKHFARTFFGDHFDETVLLRQSSPFVLSQYVVLRQAEMMQMFAEGCIGDMGDGDVEMDGETSNSTSVLTDLLLDNMEYVLKELIIHQVEVDDPANRTKEWEFLFRYLPDNFTIRDAISCRQLHLLKVLARELGGDRAVLARKAFREISQYLIQGSEANEADANAGLMMPRQYFMALMADFGSRIGSKKPASSLAYRLRAIRSMYRLFKIIDHEGEDGGVDSVAGAIDPYVPKVMAILKVGLSDMQLRTAAIQAWGAFIRLLTPKALESNFVSIVVSVLPCIPGGAHAFQADHGRDGDAWCLESMVDEDGASSSNTATDAANVASNASVSAAIGVLKYLFVERRTELKQAFPRVRLIPSVPALDEVYASYVGEVGDPSKTTLVDFLTSCLPYMTHWDMGVREIVLRELHRALVMRSMELRQLLQSEGEYVDPSVLEILFAILHITRTDGSEAIRLLCAKCLGALGALDGARIPLNVLHSAGSLTASGKELAGKEKSGKEARVELSNKDLACVLIESWLVKELRAAPETADAIAYSIQELLLCLAEMTADPQHSGQHVSGVTNNSGRRTRLQANAPMPDWMRRRFERKDVLQLVEPYWNTKYTFDIPRKAKPAETSPVFYEKYSSTYEEWLSAWCTRLIDLSQPPERSTFQACLTVISTSAAIARFLLPYLIQNVLRSGRPNVIAEVTQEMMAVLKDDGVMDDLANGVVVDAHPVLAVNDAVNDANERAFGEYASRHHQCTQTIVSAIDELNEWLWSNDKKNLALSASASRSTSTPAPSELGDPEKENLEEFIKEIPSHVLSNAAFRIKAYARALQYFEVYLRQQKPTEKVDANNVNSLLAALPVDLALVAKHATYLQQLYSRVDEPDALTGLTTLRRLYDAQRPDPRAPDGGISDPNSSLTDLLHQVVDHEQLAQWEDALACYEQAIQEINSAQAAHSFYSGEIPNRHEMHHDQIANLEVTRDPRKIKPALYSGIVQCLIQLGRLESALQHINGIVTQEPQFVGTLYPHALECAWRLSRWDLVSELLNTERQTSLLSNSLTQGGVSSRLRNLDVSQLSLVRVLHSLHEGNHVAFLKHLQEARLEIMGPLAAACAESYQRAYPLLHKLHFLHEAEQGFMSIRATSRMDPIAREKRWNEQCPWDARYDLLSASLKFRDPILALRRVMLQEADLRVEVSQNWLSYAKIARKEGYMRTATSAIMHAEALDNPYASLERAKLMVAQDRMYEALQILEPVDIDASRLDFKVEDPHYCAKNLLLATNWMQESGQRQGKKVVERYEAVIKFDPKWEKGYFFLAKYYEYLLSVSHPEAPTSMSATSSSRNDEASININATFHSHLINLMKNYVLALSHGTKHVFQAMPRLLTLWFEYGEVLQPGSNKGSSVNKAMRSIEMELSQTSTEQQILSDITQIMQRATDNLPVYEWLVCFPQVTSRICHPNPVVVEGVKKIMMKVLLTYPKQAMWPLLGLSKSLNAQRRNRAREIITATQRQFVASNQQDISNSFAEGMRLAKELIEIAGDDQATQRKIKIHLSRVRELILVPVQAGLNTVLPSSGLAPGDDRHAAFMPHSQVFIKAFSDKADVMMTKEKPKRIEVLGTDGEFYPFLCKREKTGDLRKDARMMEFNTMINKLLQKDREGRKRKLRLRTYAVVCLNEESGLMEWVRNTKAMRQLIGQIHKAERGFIQPLRLTHEIKERFLGMQKKYADNVSVMGKYYRIKILTLPVFTPRFHQWFTNNFADPTAWFEARLAFSRSAAVWSMVGHIIGLGDRHGENILIDTKNGECVHVDFDCLFDKGLKLAKPEIVPFRLTPNIIDAFGITGYEGVFRRVCEVTMELLRDNKETLRSVLESFIHDPLVEWGRRGKTAQGMTGATATGRSIADIPSDRSKEETRVILKTIDDRLTGIYNLGDAIRPLVSSSHRNLLPENETLPLSVQGQVDKLIHEATAHENLAQMYIGWMPFL